MIGADRFIDKLDAPLQAKHAMQRYGEGISEIDMWNFDSFLADVIVAGCNWYIDNALTTPWSLDKEEWDAILVEIRDGFASRDAAGLLKPPSKKVWKLLRDNFQHFWD